MRILMFAAGGDIGGGKTHILSLAKELSKDNELKLVCFRIGEMSKEAGEMGIDTVAIDHRNSWPATKALALSITYDFKPDLIHCHGSKANVLGCIVNLYTRIPVMTTVHSDPELDYMGSMKRNLTYGNLNRMALRRMNYYVAVSDSMKELLISRGFDPQKIGVVYNGMDFSCKEQVIRNSELVTVGIAARLNPVKNIETLIKAFAKAYEQNKNLRLSIAGTGEEREKLTDLADELGIQDVTTFEAWVSDIKSYFKKVDINVLCSLSETFPYSLLEGAMMGVPAIASNVGGIPRLIEHEKTGLLFEAKDVDTFADEILRLANDKELRESLAKALLEKAEREFSLERMRADQQHIYETAKKKSAKKRYGVVLCGAYGKGNAGDEAVLRSIIDSVKSIDEDMPIYVMSRKPKETIIREQVGAFFTFDIRTLRKVLKKTQLFISGGGTLMQDVTSTRSLIFYLHAIKLAKRKGAKVEMYGCGIGPINKEKNRKRTAAIINDNVDVIALRDSISKDLLDEIGVNKPEIVLTADPTVNLPILKGDAIDSAFEACGIKAGIKKAIFCIRPWDNFNDYKAIIDAAEHVYNKHGLTPVFIPMEYPRDVEIGKKLAAALSVPAYASEKYNTFEELRGMLADAELVVGMRLHSLIFAASAAVPIVAISYDVKVDSFIKDSKAKHIIKLDELNSNDLIKEIDASLSDEKAFGDETRDLLMKLEKGNIEIAKRLIGEDE